MRRSVLGVVGGLALTLMLATSALAFECTNLSKPPAAGTQVVFGPEGEIVWISRGLERRVEQGLVDPDSGEGFHGLVGFDFDGDGVVDASTYIVTPDSEIPSRPSSQGRHVAGCRTSGSSSRSASRALPRLSSESRARAGAKRSPSGAGSACPGHLARRAAVDWSHLGRAPSEPRGGGYG